MKNLRQLMLVGTLAFGLLLPAGACRESGMSADQETAEIPAGTQLYVMVDEVAQGSGITSSNQFRGTLQRAVELNGRVIIPQGTVVKGKLTDFTDADYPAGQSGTAGSESGTGMAGGDAATGSAGARDTERIGLELEAIVLNGEDHDIDTHTVPGPEIATGETRGANDERSGAESGADSEAAKASTIRGREFVFTLEDAAELPATGSMRTE